MPSLLKKQSFYDAESGRYLIVAEDGYHWKQGKKSPEESKVTKLLTSYGWHLMSGNDVWLIFKLRGQQGELTVMRGSKEWYWDKPSDPAFESSAEGKGLDSIQQALDSGVLGGKAMAKHASPASTTVNNAGSGCCFRQNQPEDSVLMISGGMKTKTGTTKIPLYITAVEFEPKNAFKLASFRFSPDASKAKMFRQRTAENLQKQVRRLGALAVVKHADESSLNGFNVISLEDFVGVDEPGNPRTAAEGDDEEAPKNVKQKKKVPPKVQPKVQPKDNQPAEEFGFGSQNRELSDQEMQEYMGRIRNEEKTPQDKFNFPILHNKNIHIVDKGGKEYDVESLKKEIMTKPSVLLKKNEKMKHSDGTAKQYYNVGLPALKGLVVNEKTGKFIIVNTCPGAGICKTFCYAMRGSYVQYDRVSMGQSQRLNLLVNHPDRFASILKAEIGAAVAHAEDGTKVGVRWHDAGDFFSPQYVKLAFDVARAFPEVEFYAYTKVADVANAEKPNNFVINFSEGALPSETKKVDLTKIKKTTVVEQKMFWDLIVTKGAHTVKNEKGQVQFKDKKAWETFKDRLVEAYQVPKRENILLYDDYVEKKTNGELGDQPKWSVVVPPGGGDVAASDPLVLVSFLMWH